MKASGRETSKLSFELIPEEQENFRRVQELLCAKLDHFPTKEEAIVWMTEFALNKIDPLRKADRARARARNASVNDEVVLRDQNKCQAELPDGTICGEAKWTHQHHVIPKEHSGSDTVENLITLCASHHRAIHAERARSSNNDLLKSKHPAPEADERPKPKTSRRRRTSLSHRTAARPLSRE